MRVLVGAFNQEKALICDCDIFAKVRFNIYWGGPFSAFYNSVINSSIITRVLLKNIVCVPLKAQFTGVYDGCLAW